VTSTATDVPDEEFIGYGPAGKYVGLKPNTVSFYCQRGSGPEIDRRVADRGYYRPVFKKSKLDEWMSKRPGRGFRSDLAHAGYGIACDPCDGPCSIED